MSLVLKLLVIGECLYGILSQHLFNVGHSVVHSSVPNEILWPYLLRSPIGPGLCAYTHHEFVDLRGGDEHRFNFLVRKFDNLRISWKRIDILFIWHFVPLR